MMHGLVANHFPARARTTPDMTLSTPPHWRYCAAGKTQGIVFLRAELGILRTQAKVYCLYELLELENARFYLSNSQQSGKYGEKLLTFCSILLAHCVYVQLHCGSKQYWIADLIEQSIR